MSTTITVTCDGCGAVQQDRENRTDPYWSAQMTSTDFPVGDPPEMYRFLSTSWDLCAACGRKVKQAITAIAGTPKHDSTEGVL